MVAAGELRVGALDADVDVLADELQTAVAQQRARQQTGFAQNLEAVADAQNNTAVTRETLDGFHDGRKARDRACPQVIPIRESAGQNNRVITIYLIFLVPDEVNGLANDLADHVIRVVIAIGAGENHYAEFHFA